MRARNTNCCRQDACRVSAKGERQVLQLLLRTPVAPPKGNHSFSSVLYPLHGDTRLDFFTTYVSVALLR